MVLENILSNNIINSVRIISRDSKIYEAFKPYFDIQNISLEDYMNNKELRRIYRKKYTVIKMHFQQQKQSRIPISDEECLIKITEQGIAWREFIETARENTTDNGASFLQSTPMDKFIMMTSRDKKVLEDKLVHAAVQRVRNFSIINQQSSTASELSNMLNDSNEEDNVTHRR